MTPELQQMLDAVSINERLPCSHPAPKPPRDVYDQMLTITLDEDWSIKTYHVHRGLLCFHSNYFAKLLNGDWQKNSSNSLELTDVKIQTFQMFYDWMHTGNFARNDGVDLTAVDIVDIYVFADYYDVQQLRNRALDVYFLYDCKIWNNNTASTNQIYSETTGKSPLRKLHSDILLKTSLFKNWNSDMDMHPKEFLADLLETCRKDKVVVGSAYGLDKGYKGYMHDMRTHFCERYHDHSKREPRAITEPQSSDSNTTVNESAWECPTRPIRRGITCYNCNKQGHASRICPELRVTCDICGRIGHLPIHCRF